ncbi:hydantoinase/oxoprolinase family protein, partial [Arthrospira platensis SPKY2]
MNNLVSSAGASSWTDVAGGLLRLASEKMAQAIREVTAREGEDPATYGLVVFGGAGGLHACEIARELGIRLILFPTDAGLLSAKGILESTPEVIVGRQLLSAEDARDADLGEVFESLTAQAIRQLSEK